MADTKLSALTELAATPAADDELYIRDVSEAAAAESKRITTANLLSIAVNSVVSDILQHSDDAEKTTISDTLVKLKEIALSSALTNVNIKFDLNSSVSGGLIRGQIFKNGVALGTLQEHTNNFYETYSENFTTLAAGDLIQVYCQRTGSFTAYIKNLRFYYSLAFIPHTNQDP